MIEYAATWRDVEKDSYIKDLSGTVWRVVLVGPSALELVDRAGSHRTIARKSPEATVTILGPTDEEAAALLGESVDGRGVGASTLALRDDGDELWRAPTMTGDQDAIRAHLTTMHGMYVGSIDSLHGLIVAHGGSHAGSSVPVPHKHS